MMKDETKQIFTVYTYCEHSSDPSTTRSTFQHTMQTIHFVTIAQVEHVQTIIDKGQTDPHNPVKQSTANTYSRTNNKP